MCGIVGFCGKSDALPFLLEGLERLEYRGYDSAGVAILSEKLISVKAKGRLCNLKSKTQGGISGTTGIGHTRWATHGAPSDNNSHPHLSKSGKFAVVHNGIIENYAEIKEFLSQRSFSFASETDTEVIGHLIEYYYRGDAIEAIIKAAQRLNGSYALAILCEDTPNQIYAMRKESPLVLALGTNSAGAFIASDMSALISYSRDFIILDSGEVAILSPNEIKIINFNRERVEKKYIHADWQKDAAQKNGFEHFMLKEIYEQPRAITDTLNNLERQIDSLSTLNEVKQIHIVACGSAYHAGMTAKYFIEKLCRIPTECETASEYRYKNPIILKDTLCIAISQSGETADTLAAMTEAKAGGARLLSVVNVPGSSVARLSDEVIYTLAGPEISVATTKGYTSQVAALYKIALKLYRSRLLDGNTNKASADSTAVSNHIQNKNFSIELKNQLKILDNLESELRALPQNIKSVLEQKEVFQQMSARFAHAAHAFFIGRGIDYPIAMEGALKLKEISYIHAQCYAAGELKHGTISLIEEGSLVVAVATDKRLFEKTISNIREVQSRGAVVFAVTCFDEVASAADYYAKIESGLNSPTLAAVSLQLFAYYTAAYRGCDIDKPRNLAKSVTVE